MLDSSRTLMQLPDRSLTQTLRTQEPDASRAHVSGIPVATTLTEKSPVVLLVQARLTVTGVLARSTDARVPGCCRRSAWKHDNSGGAVNVKFTLPINP